MMAWQKKLKKSQNDSRHKIPIISFDFFLIYITQINIINRLDRNYHWRVHDALLVCSRLHRRESKRHLDALSKPYEIQHDSWFSLRHAFKSVCITKQCSTRLNQHHVIEDYSNPKRDKVHKNKKRLDFGVC
jgi:hypothetical protein